MHSVEGNCPGTERISVVNASGVTYGSLSLTQASMTYAVSPSAQAPSADDQSQTSHEQADAQVAQQLAAANVSLTPASMSALIEAQAALSRTAPAIIRRHTAEALGQMIWNLDSAPPLSPAPMAVRQLEAARSALAQSLVDIRA